MDKLTIALLLVFSIVFQGIGQDRDDKKKGLKRIGGGSFDDDVTVIVNDVVIGSLSGLESLSDLSELSELSELSSLSSLSELSRLADMDLSFNHDFDFDFDFDFDDNIVIKIDDDFNFDFRSLDAVDVISDLDLNEIIQEAIDQKKFKKNKIRE